MSSTKHKKGAAAGFRSSLIFSVHYRLGNIYDYVWSECLAEL